MDDGLVEVVGVKDVVHLANSLGGLSNGLRICQGREIRVAAPAGGMPLQIDGEPFNVRPAAKVEGGLEPFDVSITCESQALMLCAPEANSAARRSAFSAVEEQFSARAISTSQRDGLLRSLAGR